MSAQFHALEQNYLGIQRRMVQQEMLTQSLIRYLMHLELAPPALHIPFIEPSPFVQHPLLQSETGWSNTAGLGWDAGSVGGRPPPAAGGLDAETAHALLLRRIEDLQRMRSVLFGSVPLSDEGEVVMPTLAQGEVGERRRSLVYTRVQQSG